MSVYQALPGLFNIKFGSKKSKESEAKDLNFQHFAAYTHARAMAERDRKTGKIRKQGVLYFSEGESDSDKEEKRVVIMTKKQKASRQQNLLDIMSAASAKLRAIGVNSDDVQEAIERRRPRKRSRVDSNSNAMEEAQND